MNLEFILKGLIMQGYYQKLFSNIDYQVRISIGLLYLSEIFRMQNYILGRYIRKTNTFKSDLNNKYKMRVEIEYLKCISKQYYCFFNIFFKQI